MSERLNLPSASSFHMDVSCAGRQNLLRSMREQGIPDADDSDLKELSERGQRIHEARANGGHTLHLKDESEVAAYTNGALLEGQLADSWLQDFGFSDYTIALEQRLWLHNPVNLEPVISGQVDVVRIAPQRALVADWKSALAYYVPPANRSWQLRVYAVLVWREYDGIESIRVAYVMPERLGERLDFCDLTSFDLQRIETEIFQVLWRSQQPDAQLNAGAWCRFCPARGICPAAAKMASLPTVTSNGDPLALVKAMPVEDLASVFKKKTLVTKVLDAITARLNALSDEELSAIGLKRTAGRRLDKIVDTYGAYEHLLSKGLQADSLTATMSFRKESLIALMASTWGISEKDAAQMFDNELDEFIERDRGKPSLVESK